MQMDVFIEAYVVVPKYSHSNEMAIRNVVSTYSIIHISNNGLKLGISLSAIWTFKMADLIRDIHVIFFCTQ